MATVADRIFLRRRIVNVITLLLSGAATLFGLFWLTWILWTTVTKGMNAFGLHLFTQMTPPPGEVSGGLANALFGSLMMCLLAVAMATPIGIARRHLPGRVRQPPQAWTRPSASSTTSCCRRRPSCWACSSTP